jgi:PAS domain S-box-containing protein
VAEWAAPGIAPIDDRPDVLPVSNLATRERRTVAIADVEQARELDDEVGGRDTLLAMGTRGALAAPIVVFDRLIGVLGLHTAEPRAWSEAEVGLAEAVAREAGLAVHTGEILESNRERLQQQRSLLKAAQAVSGELRLETVLQRLVAELTRLLGSDAADCYFLDEERASLRCTAVFGLDRAVIGWEFPAERGLAGQALRTGAAVLSEEYEELRFENLHPAYEGFARAIVAPMGWAGEVRGVVGVGTRDPLRRYTPADVEAVEVFANLAGLAVRNAESFEQSARQARIQQGFYGIAALLSEALSQPETLAAAARAASEALGADFAAVLARRAGTVRVAASYELPDGFADALAQPHGESRATLEACLDGARFLAAPAVATDERFDRDWRVLAEHAFSSLLILPIEHRDANAIAVVFFREQRAFTDDDLELARQLSHAARGALERSSLYEAERTAHSLSRQLARTGSRLAVELDPLEVIAEVVQQAPALLGADAAALWELVEGELVLRAGEGAGAVETVGLRLPASSRPAGDVVQSAAPVIIVAASEEPASTADPMHGKHGHEASVGVPLVGAEGGLHGVLTVYSREPRQWRTEEVQALEALAGNAAAALANAVLYQRVAMEKERLDAILASIADGIVAVDRDGAVVLWNSAAEQITGIPATEALGRMPEDIIQRSLSGDETPTGERLVGISRGGEDVWLSVTEAVMRDPAGSVSGRVYAFRDVSTERAVEQLKSDFVASVSHELRAPLTSIFGFAETLLAREGLFGERERRTFLQYIASEAERLTNIVEQLLNVARLEAGDLEVELDHIAVADVVAEAVAQAERLHDAELYRFETELPPRELQVVADGEKLQQVLTNLLDNAVKFSPEGGLVRVRVEGRPDTAEIAVIDEGIGIPQAEHELIFRKFYRAPEPGTDSRGGPGAGLGLFIARGLVRAMNGKIWVSSSESEGSRFVFELPLAGDGEGGTGEA